MSAQAGSSDNRQPQTEDTPFEGLPPQLVLDRLRKLKPEEIVGGKPFWKSYEKWEKLDQQKRTNAVVFVNSKLTDINRGKLYDDIRKDIANEVRDEKSRQAYTNKHDKARLLHVRKDPKFAAIWRRALGDKSRQELDADHNKEDASCWTELATAFNDYKENSYQNACVVPNRVSSSGAKISVPGMERIFEDCHDMDPTSVNRPERDAKWVRTNYREIKSLITLASENYRRSGNHDAENEYDEWVKFSRRSGHDVVTYARALFNDIEIQQIGRAIRSDIARDTGSLPKNDAATAAAIAADKEAWKAKRQGKKRKSSCLGNGDVDRAQRQDYGLSVASVLQATLRTQLLLEHANDNMKQRILQDLEVAYLKDQGIVGVMSSPQQNRAGRAISSTTTPGSTSSLKHTSTPSTYEEDNSEEFSDEHDDDSSDGEVK